MHLVEASIGLIVHVKVQSLPLNVTLVSPFVLLLQALLEAPLWLSVVHSCRTHHVKWSGQSWANAILQRTWVVPFDVPTFVCIVGNMYCLCWKLNGLIMLQTCMDHSTSLNNYWELCMQLVWTMLTCYVCKWCVFSYVEFLYFVLPNAARKVTTSVLLLEVGGIVCLHVYQMNPSNGRRSITKRWDK